MDPTPQNKDAVKASICELLQCGSCSPKFDQNCPSTVINDITITMKEVKVSLQSIDPSLTPRKLARSLRDDILIVAKAWGIEGNLSKRFKQQFPSATFNELVWASDFHTFTPNNAIPDDVKDWLIQNYTSRWGNKK